MLAYRLTNFITTESEGTRRHFASKFLYKCKSVVDHKSRDIESILGNVITDYKNQILICNNIYCIICDTISQ